MIDSEINHVLPAFSVLRRECGLQREPLLFSCAGFSPKYRRLCPCRDFQRGQVALCKDCLWSFKQQEREKGGQMVDGRSCNDLHVGSPWIPQWCAAKLLFLQLCLTHYVGKVRKVTLQSWRVNSDLSVILDREFKNVVSEKAAPGQYPISSLHSDKGWWTPRLSASLLLPPPVMSHFPGGTPRLR